MKVHENITLFYFMRFSKNDSTGSGRMSTPPSHIKRKTVIRDRYMVHGKDI